MSRIATKEEDPCFDCSVCCQRPGVIHIQPSDRNGFYFCEDCALQMAAEMAEILGVG